MIKEQNCLADTLTLLLFSHSVVSESLRPHGLQHARLLCPSPSTGACSNSCPLSQWYHLVLYCPLFLLLSILPSIRIFSSGLFTSGGQGIGASALASVLLMNIQDWFPLGLIGLISLLSKGLKSLLQHHSSKASILWRSAFFMVQLSYSWKNHSFDYTDLCWQSNVFAF